MGLDAAFESFARRLEATMDRLAIQLDRIDRGPTPLVYTPEEAGTVLGVSEDTVRRWVRAGYLPRLPHTDRMLIPRRAVEAFVQAASTARSVQPSVQGLGGEPIRARDELGVVDQQDRRIARSRSGRRPTAPAHDGAQVVPSRQ